MDKLATYWQGASYQDNLLQSYRGFHLTIQSILIAIGAGLSIAAITFNTWRQVLFSYLLLFIITALAIYLLLTMRKLIKARGEDVDYFHNRIIEYERTLAVDEQILTAFKVYQKFSRTKTDLHEYFQNFALTDDIRSQLIEKGKGHTRRLLDKYLYWGFYIVWLCFHLVTLSTVFLLGNNV